MSIVYVSNIHFESTANNRIQFENSSNISIIQNNTTKIISNNTGILLSNSTGSNSFSKNSISTGKNVGEYIISRDQNLLSSSNDYIRTGNAYFVNAYPQLASLSNSIPPVPFFINRQVGNNNTMRAFAYGNNVNIYVAGGNSGAVQSSTDAITWTDRTRASAQTIVDMAYGNGIFVGVTGTGGTANLHTSTNGTTWINTVSADNNCLKIAYGNGIFVIVGNGGNNQTSTNGTTWTIAQQSANTFADQSIAYGNGVWVVAGSNGSIVSSTNGTTWTNRTRSRNITSQQDIAYGNGLFVAVGTNTAVHISTDGTTWTNSTIIASSARTPTSIAYGNGIFVTAVSNNIYISTNGTTWNKAPTYDNSNNFIGDITSVSKDPLGLFYSEDDDIFIIGFGDSSTTSNSKILSTFTNQEFFVPKHILEYNANVSTTGLYTFPGYVDSFVYVKAK